MLNAFWNGFAVVGVLTTITILFLAIKSSVDKMKEEKEYKRCCKVNRENLTKN